MNELNAYHKGYVVITDYVPANTGKDVANEIQKVIDDNPRTTIYFPDGEYIISKPICTPGHFSKAVSIEMGNFAIIKASDDWSSEEAMIRLGGKDRYFRINACGTNNFISGGILDGNHRAKGLSIDGGREYSVRNISMKFVTVGLHVKWNQEYGSNDSDIFNVNIVGCGIKGSVGLLIEGFDNTFTNMRIANFEIGVKCSGAGNFMRNLHPLFIYKDDMDFDHTGEIEYADCIGFDDLSGGNFYDNCYPDNFATGFRMQGNTMSTYNCCFAYWYTIRGGVEVAFKSTGKFNSIIKSANVDLRPETQNAFLQVAEAGGNGTVENPMFNEANCQDKSYKDYLVGRITWRN